MSQDDHTSNIARRAAPALRDPWVWVTTSVAAGASWAVGLPLEATGVVAACVAATVVVGTAIATREKPPLPPRPLVPGTDQQGLVARLARFAEAIDELHPVAVGSPAADVVDQAKIVAASAQRNAYRLAAAIDDLDAALGRIDDVRPTVPGSPKIEESQTKLTARRARYLRQLEDLVRRVGETYGALIEVTTSANLTDVDSVDVDSELQDLEDRVNGLRDALDELDADLAG